jgi:hypothetical protein
MSLIENFALRENLAQEEIALGQSFGNLLRRPHDDVHREGARA